MLQEIAIAIWLEAHYNNSNTEQIFVRIKNMKYIGDEIDALTQQIEDLQEKLLDKIAEKKNDSKN